MKQIEVGRKGKYFTLNGEVTKPDEFFGIDGFKFCNHLWAWIQGGHAGKPGGFYLDLAKRYIEEEVLGNGCRRMRAPIELMFWGPPYFDLPTTNPAPFNQPNVANTLELINLHSGTGSSFHLTPGLKKLIRMYVNLAREYEIVIEVPWLWTIKGPADSHSRERLGLSGEPRERHAHANHGGVSVWNEHFLTNEGEGIVKYLLLLKTQGDGGGRSRVDPGPLNLIHDAANEYEAHSDKFTQTQLAWIARRWHERGDPGELLFISESGQPAGVYHPPLRSEVGISGYEGPCIHPPRNDTADWKWDGTGRILRDRWPKELVDVNESQMGWTEEDRRFWVDEVGIDKWEGLGTTNLNRWTKMHNNFIDNDIYTTFHTIRGMHAFWPQTPKTAVEERIGDITGGGASLPPPPEPIRRYRYEVVIAKAYEEILERNVDPGGLETYNALMLDGMPEHEMRERLIRSHEYEDKNPEV